MIKKVIIGLYILIVVCAGFATILEKLYGTEYVSEYVYGASWFVVLWSLLVVMALAYIWKQKLHKRTSVLLLHLSFVVILLGALTTHLTSERGTVHLRLNQATNTYKLSDGETGQLPFSMTLKDFRVIDYPGTEAAMNYVSEVEIKGEGDTQNMEVSMNNIGEADGYRFFQSGYDSDGEGTLLGVSYDPFGIAVTYIGYLLFLVSCLWVLGAQRKTFLGLYKKATMPLLVLLLLGTTTARAQKVAHEVPPRIAHDLCSVVVLYNDRLCPMNTAAIDFVTKLTGKSTWNGYTADEIFVGWMIYYTEWEEEKIIRVKDAEVQRMLGVDDGWASVQDFYTPQHEYKLESRLKDNSYSESTKRAIRDADEKLRTVTMFYNSEMLHIFPLKVRLPHQRQEKLMWFTPGSTELPKDVPNAEFQFIKHAMDYLVKDILVNDEGRAETIIKKIKLYQKDKAGYVMPSPTAVKAEITYNSLMYARWIVFLILTLAIVQCVSILAGVGFTKKPGFKGVSLIFMLLFALYVTMLLCMRWWLSGHLPLSNGFETMLFMSWISIIVTLCTMKKLEIMRAFGPLLASLCLLIAMLASGTPQITQMMPVLQSPLLSVHVMLVMFAYSLFALLMFLGLQGTWYTHTEKTSQLERTTALSRMILYPAMACLGLGIFIGAIWANVSWGTYWSWDPKETWALITFMIYAVPLHGVSLPAMKRPMVYHLYMILAFFSVLFTYFGVNYVLGGMHSYA